MRRSVKSSIYFVVAIAISLASCTTQGPSGFFGKKNPHDAYSDKIASAGLNQTALGRSWLYASEQSLVKALSVTLPYSEAGYFAAERAEAVGVKFKAKRGEKLAINLNKKPQRGFAIYMDLWEAGNNNSKPTLLLSADTSKSLFDFEVKKDGFFIIRLQPELLVSGEYTLSINTGPSLVFPVPAKAKPTIGSYWGDNRDNGGRRHEGIDIFAPFRTPLVASANGTINRVEENELGGKVVFLNPDDGDYTLYYAHLDEQLARPGQTVRVGDTIGLMGNTGNAATTAPHLHFGIYTFGGAIDPLAFVNPVIKKPVPITASETNIGRLVRTGEKIIKMYGAPEVTPSNFVNIDPASVGRVSAASASWYKVTLPQGQQGYIQATAISTLNKPLRKVRIASPLALMDAPNNDAARKATLEQGQTVNVVGAYKDYYYINRNNDEGWILKSAIK